MSIFRYLPLIYMLHNRHSIEHFCKRVLFDNKRERSTCAATFLTVLQEGTRKVVVSSKRNKI